MEKIIDYTFTLIVINVLLLCISYIYTNIYNEADVRPDYLIYQLVSLVILFTTLVLVSLIGYVIKLIKK